MKHSKYIVLCLLISASLTAQQKTEASPKTVGKGVLVFEERCITVVEKTPNTKLECPLKDNGETDKDHCILKGVKAIYAPACGHIEIRHDEMDTHPASRQ